MKKENIIKKSFEIKEVINNGKKLYNSYYSIFIKNNNYNKDRFAICVSKKLGNAVTRNKNKRQVKDIIDKSNLLFSNEKDYVIILRNDINNLKFIEKKENLINLLKGDLDEKK